MTPIEYNICVDNYSKDLYRFAYKTIGSAEEAEDVLQTTFETLWKEHKNVEKDKARSYLFTIVYRRCMDYFRQKKDKHFVEIDEVSPIKVYDNAYEWKELLHKALDNLDLQTRTLILLKDIDGYKYDEIATLTGLSLEQVKVYLHRGRKLLKNHLKSQNAYHDQP